MSAAVALLLITGWGAIADARGAAAAETSRSAAEKIAEICSNDALASSVVGILALTMDGDTIVAVNPELKMVPASNVKLITTGLALKVLGKDFRFSTGLAYSGSIQGGVLKGDLYIVGGGDPTTGANNVCADPLESLFSRWLGILRGAGIRSIEGRIIADPRFFDSPNSENLGWSYDDLGTNYGTGPQGLNFFENAQNFHITPGAAPGARPKIEARYPQTPWMSYSVTAVTGGKGTANTVFYVNTPLAPVGDFGGSFPVDRNGYTYKGSNRFGAYTCAYYFLNYLKDKGMRVSGGCADIDPRGMIRTEPGRYANSEAALPKEKLTDIGNTLSANLASIIYETNHESDNFFAEALLKMTGLNSGYSCFGDGSLKAAEQILASMGLPVRGRCQLADGSGLSRKNYISASYFVDFLTAMTKEPEFDVYLKSIPVPGSRGTIEHKFFFTGGVVLRERIHMKSGSMNGIRCYSGYILPSGDGDMSRTIAFSVMTNNVTVSSWAASPLVDAIIMAIAAEN